MGIFGRIDTFITWFDGVVWGLPLIILILVTGIFLTVRLGLLQVRYLGKALKFMVKNPDSIFRNGNKVFRRSSGSKIPYDR